MATALLPALRRTVLLSVLAFAAASLAFGTVMLTSPPISGTSIKPTSIAPHSRIAPRRAHSLGASTPPASR